MGGEGKVMSLVAASSDGRLRQLSGSELTLDIDIAGGKEIITQLAVSERCATLFAGTSKGAICVYDWPMSRDPSSVKPRQVLSTHNGSVTSLKLSTDGCVLFSGGEDGALFGYAVKRIERGIELVWSLNTEQFNLDTALVGREDLESMMSHITALEKAIEDLKSKSKFDLHCRDTEWQERLKKLSDEHEAALGVEANRYSNLQDKHLTVLRDHAEERERSEANHVHVSQELENRYE